jgi:transcriptional regulator with XRE-family HTH domain
MNRQELKSKIPHGSANEIAKKAGVNRITVSNWLNNKSDNVNVEMAVLELVAELSDKKSALLARIK